MRIRTRLAAAVGLLTGTVIGAGSPALSQLLAAPTTHLTAIGVGAEVFPVRASDAVDNALYAVASGGARAAGVAADTPARDGKNCNKGHALVVEMGVTFHSNGDLKLLKIDVPRVLQPRSEDGKQPPIVLISGRRLTPKVVLCHGDYRFTLKRDDGSFYTGPAHRFEAGHAKASTKIELEGDLRIRLYARWRR